MSRMKAVSSGTPKAALLSRAAHRSSQTDAKHRAGGLRRIAVAALGAAALALVGASAAEAATTAYVTNANKDVVTPINLTEKTVGTGINVGVFTSSIAITPNGEFAYVPTYEGDAVTPIKLATPTVESAITLITPEKKVEPEAVAITPDGKYAYVIDEEAKGQEGAISVVDIATKEVVKTIEKVGDEPEGIAFASEGKYAYVADKATEKQGTVTVIEKANEPANATVEATQIDIGNAGTKTAPCVNEGVNPPGACVEPEKIAIYGERAYVADGASGMVTVIDTANNTVVEEIEVGGAEVGGNEPDNIAVTPNGKTAYAVDGKAGKVVPIEISNYNVGTKITVGKMPHGLAVNNELVVVADEEEANVKTIETSSNSVKETFSVEGEPDGVAIAP